MRPGGIPRISFASWSVQPSSRSQSASSATPARQEPKAPPRFRAGCPAGARFSPSRVSFRQLSVRFITPRNSGQSIVLESGPFSPPFPVALVAGDAAFFDDAGMHGHRHHVAVDHAVIRPAAVPEGGHRPPVDEAVAAGGEIGAPFGAFHGLLRIQIPLRIGDADDGRGIPDPADLRPLVQITADRLGRLDVREILGVHGITPVLLQGRTDHEPELLLLLERDRKLAGLVAEPQIFCERGRPVIVHLPLLLAGDGGVAGVQRRNHITVVFIRIRGEGQPPLLQVARAGDAAGSLARLVQRGQQHGGENRDDRNSNSDTISKFYIISSLSSTYIFHLYLCRIAILPD